MAKRAKTYLLIGGVVGLAFYLVFQAEVFEPKAKPVDTNLSFLHLKPDQLLARVGSTEVHGDDLRDFVQLQFHGELSHARLTNDALSARLAVALEQLIGEELLANEARARGLVTTRSRALGRRDLVDQLLSQELQERPDLKDEELEAFYKNHPEKFSIPPANRVKELFLPHRSTQDIDKNSVIALGRELAQRLRDGQLMEQLAAEHVPAAYRQRVKARQYGGDSLEEPEARAVLRLRPGEVAGPYRVEGGYSVFQGVARVPGRVIPFGQVRQKILVHLEARRQREARKALVDELRRRLPVERLVAEAGSNNKTSHRF